MSMRQNGQPPTGGSVLARQEYGIWDALFLSQSHTICRWYNHYYLEVKQRAGVISANEYTFIGAMQGQDPHIDDDIVGDDGLIAYLRDHFLPTTGWMPKEVRGMEGSNGTT